MYGIHDYGHMLDDAVRMRAYEAALRAAITPGCTVLDLGTGIGGMAILACRLGAGRVVAVEPTDGLLVARQLAAANGLADRIECVQGLSTDLVLPTPADVVVSDLRGALPLLGKHLATVADARRRLIAPGGTLIPLRDTLRVTLVEAPEAWTDSAGRWPEALGIQAAPFREIVTNRWGKARITPDMLLAEPVTWGVLEYHADPHPDIAATVTLEVARDGTAHGLGMWFDAELTPGVRFSTAPGEPDAIYGRAFFPLSAPVVVAGGDTVELAIRARLVDDDYAWGWRTRIVGADGRDKAHFDQHTLRGTPRDPARLRRGADDFVPRLSTDGAVLAAALAAMDGTRPLAAIADQLLRDFPARFASRQAALRHVATLSQRHAE